MVVEEGRKEVCPPCGEGCPGEGLLSIRNPQDHGNPGGFGEEGDEGRALFSKAEDPCVAGTGGKVVRDVFLPDPEEDVEKTPGEPRPGDVLRLEPLHKSRDIPVIGELLLYFPGKIL